MFAVGFGVTVTLATDADAGDSHTFTLVSGSGDTDNSAFTISGNQLLTARIINFEVETSLSIRVRAEDG